MNNLIKFVAIAFFSLAIAFNIPAAIADTASNDADSAQQAAQEVVKSTGAKEQFGKSANGDRLLDNAQEKASAKLDELASSANSGEELPESKKLFLKNLKPE